MGGKSKKKKAKREAEAAARAQESERLRIQMEAETMQRQLGEQLSAKRRARQRTGAMLLGAPRANIGMEETETLG